MQSSAQDRVTGRGFRSRRGLWALLAGVAACGGTTGLEKILASPDAPADPLPAGLRFDGSAAPATNPLDAVPNDALDAAANDPIDATPDALLYDRSVPQRPPPQDTGAAVAPVDATPKRPDAGTSPDSGPLTTLSILAAQSPDCLTLGSDGAIGGCAGTNGCLDPALQGGVCETVPGMAKGGGISEAQLCLQTLQDVFASKCAAAGSETPCLCGATNAMSCLAGTATPAGPVYPDYVEDFGPNIAMISVYFALPAYGAGQANAIVQCLQIFNCQSCFGTGVADAGAEASGS